MENRKLYCVYMHRNKINDKKYIGITCRKPEHRWGKDGHSYKGQVFKKAIEKYGEEYSGSNRRRVDYYYYKNRIIQLIKSLLR